MLAVTTVMDIINKEIRLLRLGVRKNCFKNRDHNIQSPEAVEKEGQTWSRKREKIKNGVK